MNKIVVAGAFLAIFGQAAAIQPEDPQQAFWDHLTALCGKTFAGEPVNYDEALDQDWLTQSMVIHVRECSENEIKIPLLVGEDRSRTWVVTRVDGGLRLKHDHRQEDGSEHGVTWYGGHTTDPGRGWRQTFPVDDYSRALFLAHGLDASVTNLWSMEIHPGRKFAYEVIRQGRYFRVEFDLSEAFEPPPPRGHE